MRRYPEEVGGGWAAGSAVQAHRSPLRIQLFLLVKIVLTLAVLGLLIITIHPREIVGAVRGANFPLVAVSLVLVLPGITLKALKWGYLLKQVKPSVSLSEVWNTLLVGFTFAVVTPGQIGEVGRAFFISGRPRLELIGLSFIDKWFNLLPIILFGSLSLLLLPGLVMDGNTYLFVSCGVLVALLWFALLLITLSPRWVRDFFYAINIMLPYRDKVKILLSGLDPIARRQALVLTILGVAHYLVYIVQFYLLVRSFHSVAFFDSFRASAATIFVKAALPISIGGLGVGETAAVGFYRLFDVSQAAAFNSSVLLFSMNVLLPAVIGVLVLLKLRIVLEEQNHE